MTIDVKKLMWDIGCGELTPGIEHYAVTPVQLDNLIAAARLQGAEDERKKHCACQWDADDNRTHTCVRHQGWLDVVSEWADRAKAAEANHPASVNQGLLEALEYIDSENASEEVLRRACAAIAAAEKEEV